ncbi:RDD family protein [Nocardia puris]|uniref:Putative RDD family membrane protein YckC n=1 Tax=Nocardia puris TaxID=208602 RepID=A0A366DP63_9NOCA|nr:RDD family protein [Nocardia puris]MBF6214163.1 RDD family protein [Nocardia puris]MBF6365347.1 RDD family protein [Nocardia puris]MBF6459749.1 RDD family protein [Nocardia puris]RBO91705.1 putative RDD family membrane protein YckC [Nocardia puris]
MAEFTTGEAVALELPIARIPTRAAAFLIDLAAQFALAVLLILLAAAIFASADLDSAWQDAAVTVCMVTVLVGYPVTWETATRGRTPGKMALGLRVIRADGGPVEFRHSLTRGLGGAIVDFWLLGMFGLVAVVTSLCSPNARRVGDVLAGTVVVHAQQPLPVPALAYAPPWLAGWATRLDLSGVPEDLALAIRQYLTRLRTLTPAAHDTLGPALVSALCTHLRVPPPAGYPPVQILGAVISERQRRVLAPGPGLVRTR